MIFAKKAAWIQVLSGRSPFCRKELIRSFIAGGIFALLFCYALIPRLTMPSAFDDWDLWLSSQLAAFRTIRDYHQFPWWNPFACGGNPLLGNPQSHFLTPAFLLTIFLGPIAGLHLEVLLGNVIAWTGCYALGRILAMRRLAAVCVAIIYAGSSWFYLRATEGHFPLLALCYLPWILAVALEALKTKNICLASFSGALIALTFFEGGPYPALYSALTLVLVLAFLAVETVGLWPIFIIGVVAIFSVGFSAIKLLPAIELLRLHPRVTDAGYSNTAHAIFVSLFSSNQDLLRPGVANGGWGFWESGAYLGIFAVPASIGLISSRRMLPWLFAAIVLLILSRGWTGPNCLYVWLHKLPGFSSTRLPSRLLIPFVLMVALMAGIGIDWICDQAGGTGFACALVAIVLGTVNLWLVGPANLAHLSSRIVPSVQPQQRFMQSRRAPAAAMLQVELGNSGVVNCYEYTDWPSSVAAVQDPGYRGEQYLLGAGSVELVDWTPNRLTYRVSIADTTILLLNQNYYPSWKLISGHGNIINYQGLIGLGLPPGDQVVTLAYRDRAALLGVLISLATSAFALIIALRDYVVR